MTHLDGLKIFLGKHPKNLVETSYTLDWLTAADQITYLRRRVPTLVWTLEKYFLTDVQKIVIKRLSHRSQVL